MHPITWIKYLLLCCTVFLGACGLMRQHEYTDLAGADQKVLQEWSRLNGGENVTILGDLIRSRKLEGLVDEALDANPSLQQTLLTLRISQAELRQTSGNRWPQAEAGYSVSKEEGSRRSYSGSLSISWEVDLWGKINDSVHAAEKTVAEQRALYQEARDTLAAEVMQSWLNLIEVKKNIAIQERHLQTLERIEKFNEQRYQSGLGTLADLNSSRTSTESSKATLEEYREALAQEQRALRTLLGSIGGEDVAVPDDYMPVALPMTELPEQTLRRRPDLKAAYLAIEAARLETSVAYKDMLPTINLQVMLEDIATSPGHSLLTDPVWSLLGQLTAPLFQGGKLKAAADIAELETAQSYQAYRETLIDAVQEVEDAIGKEHSLNKQLEHVSSALKSSQANLEQYESNYRSGLVDILDLLEIQTQTYDLENQSNTLFHDILANRIDLGLALGLGAKNDSTPLTMVHPDAGDSDSGGHGALHRPENRGPAQPSGPDEGDRDTAPGRGGRYGQGQPDHAHRYQLRPDPRGPAAAGKGRLRDGPTAAQGSIHIVQKDDMVEITNDFTDEADSPQDLGFGLGLQLIRQLAEKLGWPYSSGKTADKHKARISLG